MTTVHITDLESAINFWRERKPSPDGVTLAKEIRALADLYARMVYHRCHAVEVDLFDDVALKAWMDWYHTTPDTPCIAICSTSQGDELCKGCGRTFDEVQLWTEMDAFEKRHTWRRITVEAQAWRFNRYAERAIEDVRAAS